MIEVSLGPQKLKKDVLMAEEKKKNTKNHAFIFFWRTLQKSQDSTSQSIFVKLRWL